MHKGEHAMTEDDLRQRWPAAFNDMRRPLKVGIHADMGLTGRSEAMRWWVNHPLYLRNVIAGGERIDLEGRPAGKISECTQEYAWSALQLRRMTIADAMMSRRRRLPLPHPCVGVAVADQGREMRLSMPKLKGRSVKDQYERWRRLDMERMKEERANRANRENQKSS
jgi:sRNA-binding protein